MINLFDLSPIEAVKTFCNLLSDEISYRKDRGLDAEKLLSYYKGLFRNDSSINAFGAEGYARRIKPTVKEIMDFRGRPKVLDAGCGYGTEAILFSLLGAEVVGIELVSDRLELAKSRIDFYQNQSGAPLLINLVNKNILRFLETSDTFDIIWAMESISHIYPLEEFLRLAVNRLNPYGKIIVSDPNLISPIAFLRAFNIRGSLKQRIHRRFLDPDTGRPVDYAIEKIFSTKGFSKYLKKNGLRINRVEMAGFLGSNLFPEFFLRSRSALRLMIGLQGIFKKLPLLRQMGTIYTIIAEKN